VSLTPTELLQQAFHLAHQGLRIAVKRLSTEQILWRPQEGANSIAFYLWHIPRTTDFYLHRRILGGTEIWASQEWEKTLPVLTEGSSSGIGTGFTDQQVGAMPALAVSTYVSYLDAVESALYDWLGDQTPEQLDAEIQREGFQKAQVLRVLLSALGHTHGHTGEIGYIKGLMGTIERV